MTAAVRLLVDHALTVWQLNRVEIIVATGNRRSRAIPERTWLSPGGDAAAVPTNRRPLSRLHQLLDAGGRLARSRMTGLDSAASNRSTTSTSRHEP